MNDWLGSRVVRPLHGALVGLTASERATRAAYRRGLAFREAARDWPEARRRAWVLDALRRTVRHAWTATRFYREFWAGSGFDPRVDFDFDDFARLPVLHRADLQRAGDAAIAADCPPRELRRDATGGSTGRPLEIRTGPEERGWRLSGSEAFMRRLGVAEGVRKAFLWGHHLDPVRRATRGERMRDLLANRRWLESLRMSPEALDSYDRELAAFDPACVVAYASALASLAEHLERRGGPRPSYPRTCFVTGAEKLYTHQRALVERVFGRPVFERYGGRDVGDLAFQYSQSSPRFEVDWALALVEPETGDRPAPLLVTKLHADGMPMIRYANDDLAVFPPDARPGHPAFVLEEVTGRVAERVALRDGRWVSGLFFPHLLKDFAVHDFQVLQGRDFGVTVRVVPRDAFSPAERERLLQVLRANLPGLEVVVTLVPAVERVGANKWRPVLSEVAT